MTTFLFIGFFLSLWRPHTHTHSSSQKIIALFVLLAFKASDVHQRHISDCNGCSHSSCPTLRKKAIIFFQSGLFANVHPFFLRSSSRLLFHYFFFFFHHSWHTRIFTVQSLFQVQGKVFLKLLLFENFVIYYLSSNTVQIHAQRRTYLVQAK